MKSQIETILKRSDGSRVKVIATIRTDPSYMPGDQVKYSLMVVGCQPRKRTWSLKCDLYLLTPNEILKFKHELWKSIEPKGN